MTLISVLPQTLALARRAGVVLRNNPGKYRVARKATSNDRANEIQRVLVESTVFYSLRPMCANTET